MNITINKAYKWLGNLFTIGTLSLFAIPLMDNSIEEETAVIQIEDSYINKTIFFIASEQPSDKILILNARSACSIESAAVHNENWNIILVALDVIDFDEESIYIQTLRTYPNVHFMNTTLYELAKGTPIEDWVTSDGWKKTNSLVEHASDLLRLILMWKYGGVYLDTDLISFVNYDVLKPNWIAASTFRFINGAAMSVASNGFGHNLADIFLRQFIKNFNGSAYNANGGELIMRVLKFICSTEIIKDMSRELCIDFEVLKPNSFYTVNWNKHERLFSEEEQDVILNLYKDSYGIHFWNSASKRTTGKKGVGALNIFGSRHCPKIYAVTEELF